MEALTRRTALKTALKGTAYAVPLILAATPVAAAQAQISGPTGSHITSVTISVVPNPRSITCGGTGVVPGVGTNQNIVSAGITQISVVGLKPNIEYFDSVSPANTTIDPSLAPFKGLFTTDANGNGNGGFGGGGIYDESAPQLYPPVITVFITDTAGNIVLQQDVTLGSTQYVAHPCS